jgi:hypothetical protein
VSPIFAPISRITRRVSTDRSTPSVWPARTDCSRATSWDARLEETRTENQLPTASKCATGRSLAEAPVVARID